MSYIFNLSHRGVFRWMCWSIFLHKNHCFCKDADLFLYHCLSKVSSKNWQFGSWFSAYLQPSKVHQAHLWKYQPIPVPILHFAGVWLKVEVCACFYSVKSPMVSAFLTLGMSLSPEPLVCLVSPRLHLWNMIRLKDNGFLVASCFILFKSMAINLSFFFLNVSCNLAYYLQKKSLMALWSTPNMSAISVWVLHTFERLNNFWLFRVS